MIPLINEYSSLPYKRQISSPGYKLGVNVYDSGQLLPICTVAISTLTFLNPSHTSTKAILDKITHLFITITY